MQGVGIKSSHHRNNISTNKQCADFRNNILKTVIVTISDRGIACPTQQPPKDIEDISEVVVAMIRVTDIPRKQLHL